MLGIAALVLPGPGLILLALGPRGARHPVRVGRAPARAGQGARDQDRHRRRRDLAADRRSPPSALSGIIAVGVFWGISPAAPDWWPLDDKWWLPGGWGTGSSLIISGLIALGLVVYSYREFRGEKAEQS